MGYMALSAASSLEELEAAVQLNEEIFGEGSVSAEDYGTALLSIAS
jgi:hypothetical protein